MDFLFFMLIVISGAIAIFGLGVHKPGVSIISVFVGIACIFLLVAVFQEPFEVKETQIRLTQDKQIELEGSVFKFDEEKKVTIITKGKDWSIEEKREYKVEDYE